jgi:hypothetical protein
MNYDRPSMAPVRTYKKEEYELYSQFYEKEDADDMIKELTGDGHKVLLRKKPKVDNSYGLYVLWSQANPFT